MESLDLATITKWGSVQNWWHPISVDTYCPFCGRLVNFALTNHVQDKHRRTISSTGRCTGCGEDASFWVVDPGPANDVSKQGCSELAMFPSANAHRAPVVGHDAIPDRIRRAYLETVEVFNAGVWSATATCTRRTLEGLVKEMTEKQDRTPLGAALKELARSPRLAEPIIKLSDLLRAGGNIGAHFDLDREPDKEMACAMLDLLDYLLEYVYGLPAMIDALAHRIEALQQRSGAGAEGEPERAE